MGSPSLGYFSWRDKRSNSAPRKGSRNQQRQQRIEAPQPKAKRANTPAPIVDKVSDLVRKALASAEGKTFINNLGGIVFTGTPAQFGDFQVKEIEATRQIVKAAHIPVE